MTLARGFQRLAGDLTAAREDLLAARVVIDTPRLSATRDTPLRDGRVSGCMSAPRTVAADALQPLRALSSTAATTCWWLRRHAVPRDELRLPCARRHDTCVSMHAPPFATLPFMRMQAFSSALDCAQLRLEFPALSKLSGEVRTSFCASTQEMAINYEFAGVPAGIFLRHLLSRRHPPHTASSPAPSSSQSCASAAERLGRCRGRLQGSHMRRAGAGRVHGRRIWTGVVRPEGPCAASCTNCFKNMQHVLRERLSSCCLRTPDLTTYELAPSRVRCVPFVWKPVLAKQKNQSTASSQSDLSLCTWIQIFQAQQGSRRTVA
ncbi:hypothetical protein VTO73DRAFT_11687 [Trametes versicolor]